MRGRGHSGKLASVLVTEGGGAKTLILKRTGEIFWNRSTLPGHARAVRFA